MSSLPPRFWVSLLCAVWSAAPVAAGERLLLNGAGASFPQPLYVRWFENYTSVDESVEFNYRGLGSAGGRKLVAAGEVDFGATDVPVSGDAKAAASIEHLPTVASAVAICYNLPGVAELKLDGPTVAAIFLGRITRWTSPEIQQQNPQANLPDRQIVPIHLSEGGTLTDIFARYLAAVSPDCATRFAGNARIEWPTGADAYGNVGAARLLRETEGGIGYLEWSAAKNHGVQIAALKNAAGTYLPPSIDSITAAIAATDIPDDFRFAVINPPGERSYPVGILTWLLVNRSQLDAEKCRKLAAFLQWAYADGVRFAPSLGFAPLPANLRSRVSARLAEFRN